MLPGGASSDEPCGDDCALHADLYGAIPSGPDVQVERPKLHQTPERSSDAPRSTAPMDPPPLAHCFVTAEDGRVPGLVMEWADTEHGRLARVVHPVMLDDGWELREEWVPGGWVERG